ncbi:MAG TPA: hypothetical protein VI758_04540, partial [Bacteroidota bacterium]
MSDANNKLQFQGEKSPSIAPKVAIASWYLFCVTVAVWMTSVATETVDRSGNASRQATLFACAVVYIAR